MKKRIVSLVLTGALTLSAASTVFASTPQGKKAPENPEETSAGKEPGGLLDSVISLLGLEEECETIYKVAGALGLDELPDKLLGDDVPVRLIELADKLGLDELLMKAVDKDSTAELDRLLDSLGLKECLNSAVGADSVSDITRALVFPSWEKDSKALDELIAFVSECTDESSPKYVEPRDRIATFDMDGTILCEKAPIYMDWCMTMHRVLDDPTYHATEEEKAAMEQIREHAYTKGETFFPEGAINKDVLVATAFAGMTPLEFRAYVNDFAGSVQAVGFEGMTYAESFYRPMIEVIDYLKANDFDVWMVSACEREVVRGLMEQFDFPYDHIIATDVPYVASGKGSEEADEYNMSQDEVIVLGQVLDPVECGKSAKSAAIAREIGKRPILAFGNSTGDYSMLNYAESNPDHEGMGFFVVCDDTVREYGSDEKAAEYYAVVEKEDWTAISMANDWAQIYGENVKKTALPGAAAEAKEAA